MVGVPPEIRRARAKRASVAATEALAQRVDPLDALYGEDNVHTVLHLMAAAKQRCTNPSSGGYKDYGGRGIEFKFPSIRAAAEWILHNLGARPDKTTIDRIDNNRHYEPGNLRWATRTEQARNKRAYKRTEAGERIRRIQAARPDLTYETLRQWINAGLSDDDIVGRPKYARASV